MADKELIIELPEPVLGAGKQQLLPKIVKSLKDLPFLFCGPPGVGKKSLLQIAAKDANLKVKGAYDLSQISRWKWSSAVRRTTAKECDGGDVPAGTLWS